MMNVKKAPFNDPRVREAIQLAIDYQQWNDLVFENTSGTGCPLMGLAHTFEECAEWPGLRPKNGPGGQADLAPMTTSGSFKSTPISNKCLGNTLA